MRTIFKVVAVLEPEGGGKKSRHLVASFAFQPDALKFSREFLSHRIEMFDPYGGSKVWIVKSWRAYRREQAIEPERRPLDN